MSRHPSRTAVVAKVQEHWLLACITLVLAAVPMLRMVGLIRSSNEMQSGDYWAMLDQMLAEDGAWRLRGFIEFRNEHPIVVPKLAYALNVELFGGSNQTLGYLVVLTVAATVALVALLAINTRVFSRWAMASVTVSAAFLLFAQQGVWNFAKAMSGTAWLTANLFALAAITAQRGGRRFLTPALGLAATFSYGTGLAVWPALVIAAGLRNRRQAVREWPTALVGVAALGWYGLIYRTIDESALPRPPLRQQAEQALEVIGSLVANGSAAVAVGVVVLVTLGVFSVILTRRGQAAEWLGLASYAAIACVLISMGRPGPLSDFGASRYTSLSALTWLAMIAVILAVLPSRWWVALSPLPVVVAVALGGSGAVDAERNQDVSRELLAIGMRLGLTDGARMTYGEPFPEISSRAEQVGHYPYRQSFEADCGLLGEQVLVGDAPANAIGSVATESPFRFPGTTAMTGSVNLDSAELDCVVVLDDTNTVVGAGATTTRPAAPGLLFTTLAPEGSRGNVYVRLAGDGQFLPLEDRRTAGS